MLQKKTAKAKFKIVIYDEFQDFIARVHPIRFPMKLLCTKSL